MTDLEAAEEAGRRGLRCWVDSGFCLAGPPGACFTARASNWDDVFALLDSRKMTLIANAGGAVGPVIIKADTAKEAVGELRRLQQGSLFDGLE